MAGMLQEEHPFSLMYKIFLKMCLVYTSSWVHISTKFNGVFFFGLIMDLTLRRCWKNIKKVLKRVSKIACFLGLNYGRLKTGRKTTTFYPPNGFGCHFQRLSPIELKFYMEQHNTLNNFSYFMAPPLKMLKKYTFFCDELNLCFFVNIFLIQFVAKKRTFLAFSEIGP